LEVFESGPLPYLLLPFRLVVAPYFAASYTQFLIALLPVLGIIWLHYLWVIHSNVAFEEASVEFSRKLAERLAAARSGILQAARRPKKAARPPFVLRPTGHPAVAVFWKNLISAGQYVTARVWLMLVWVAVTSAACCCNPIRARGTAGWHNGRFFGDAAGHVAFLRAAGVAQRSAPGLAGGRRAQDVPHARLADCAGRSARAGRDAGRRAMAPDRVRRPFLPGTIGKIRDSAGHAVERGAGGGGGFAVH
jgi:hypothetical protein